MNAQDVLRRADALADDPDWKALAQFKAKGGKVVGMAPAYVPTEIIDAAGALPAHLWGVGGGVEVVQGDAYFQSAICHLPRGLVELQLRGSLEPVGLFIAPSTCDVMRNLTGIWQIAFPGKEVHYMDLPQRDDDLARWFYRRELRHLLDRVEKLVGKKVTDEDLRAAIVRENARRDVLNEIDAFRTKEPWRIPASEFVTLVRAGSQLTPAEHTRLLREYLDARKAEKRSPADVARVLLTGAFCEAPPIGFLRTLERAGCAIVADDVHLGLRWIEAQVSTKGDPLDAISDGYVSHGALAPCRYEGPRRRGDELIKAVKRHGAQGAIVCSPSFCDPALLDRPGLLAALETAQIPSIQLQYAENSVDYGSVREQAGTFADALRLWEAA